jgi:hypothetical protein
VRPNFQMCCRTVRDLKRRGVVSVLAVWANRKRADQLLKRLTVDQITPSGAGVVPLASCPPLRCADQAGTSGRRSRPACARSGAV